MRVERTAPPADAGFRTRGVACGADDQADDLIAATSAASASGAVDLTAG
ncbi:hypothetical protein [Streptomyces sp. NPDC003032]